MPNWKSAQRAGVITVRIDDMKAGDDVWVLLRSDAHHDSPYCDRKLEKYHLEIAKERNALILDNGDTFDAMQGKFDPRRSYGDIRPEDKVKRITTVSLTTPPKIMRRMLITGLCSARATTKPP